MVLIVGIGIGHAGEQVLEVLARQQVAILQRFLAEFGQIGIARSIRDDFEPTRIDLLAVGHGIGRAAGGDGLGHRVRCGGFHQLFRT